MPRYRGLCVVSVLNPQFVFEIDLGTLEDLEPCRQRTVTSMVNEAIRTWEHGFELKLNFGHRTSLRFAASDIFASPTATRNHDDEAETSDCGSG
jgi:hypothetical protein